MITPLDTKRNLLLAGLPEADYERLLPELERVPLTLGETLHRGGEAMHHAYFPIDAIVSRIYVMKSGDTAEIAVIGREGVVGTALFMGGETTPSDAVVQHPGLAWRIQARTFNLEFSRGDSFQRLLLLYTQALMIQMGQTAVCNRHHSLDKQLCRWLLLSIDRLPSNQIHMTQNLIANMLGVRREGVTRALGVLVRAGLVKSHRGRVLILDRPGLEARACECYAVVEKTYEHLLPAYKSGPL